MRSLAPPTSKSSLESPPPSPTFCRTCINNQKVINDAITTYDLPPEDHPEYSHRLNKFSRFKEEVEARYPPVCAECAPKVNERLRTSNYQVKVASLGQMLARSKGKARASQRSNGIGRRKMFERIVWWLRGGVWCYSQFIMLAWHGTAMLRLSECPSLEPASWTRCITQSIAKRDVDVSCHQISSNNASWFVPWSALGAFWVYKELELQRNPDKKLVRGKEYFKLEITVYLIRLFSWWICAPGGWIFTVMDPERVHLVHLGFFALSLLLTLLSLACLKVEDPPKISLREPEPISGSPPRHHRQLPSAHQTIHSTNTLKPLPSSQRLPPSTTMSSHNHSLSQDMTRRTSKTPSRRTSSRYGEPISPDPMDWDPIVPSPSPPLTQSFDGTTSSQWGLVSRLNQSFDGATSSQWDPALRPLPPAFSRSNSAPKQLPETTSFFSGTLPPAPKHASHKMVDSIFAKQQPVASPGDQLVREQFFAHRVSDQSASSLHGSQWEKLSDPNHRLTSPRYPPMAQPTFFVPDDSTGLADFLGSRLKIIDEPFIEPAPKTEDSLATLVIRTGLLVAAGGIYFVAKSREVVGAQVFSLLLATIGALWKLSSSYSFSPTPQNVLGGTLFASLLISSCFHVPLERTAAVTTNTLTTASYTLLFSALLSEFWSLQVTLKHNRARKLWDDEQKRSLAQEKAARKMSQRRREPTVSPTASSFASRATSPEFAMFGARGNGLNAAGAGARAAQNGNPMGATRMRGLKI
ncbi:hypothetical protein RUND412_001507 [Rhizina undulata]